MRKLVNSKFVRAFSGEAVQTVFKLSYLWLVMLSFNSFFAETTLLSCCSYLLALFGAPIVVARIIDFKSYKGMPLVGLMTLFLLSFIVSAVGAMKYGIVQNIQGFVWLTFEFLILFAHSARESVNHAWAELAGVAKSVFWYALLCSCLGLAMAAVGYSESVAVAEGVANQFGVLDGRLWGVYSDPNIGAVLCVLAVLFSLWLHSRGEIRLALLVAGVIVQFCFIALSGSRGALLCVASSSFVVVGLLCWRKFADDPLWRRTIKSSGPAVCGCGVVVVCAFVLGFAFQKSAAAIQGSEGYSQPTHVIGRFYSTFESVEEATFDEVPVGVNDVALLPGIEESSQIEDLSLSAAGDYGANAVDLGSRFVAQDDISSFSAGRVSIWKSAIDVFKSSPLVGVSHRNILSYSQDVLPDTFIARAGYTTMHNILFDVLVSQGLIGFCLFLSMALAGLKSVISFLRQTNEECIQGVVLVGVLVAVCVAAMFYTEILYINSPLSVLFWIALGAVCHGSRATV